MPTTTFRNSNFVEMDERVCVSGYNVQPSNFIYKLLSYLAGRRRESIFDYNNNNKTYLRGHASCELGAYE